MMSNSSPFFRLTGRLSPINVCCVRSADDVAVKAAANTKGINLFIMHCSPTDPLRRHCVIQKKRKDLYRCSSADSRLWHVPITEERATRSLTLYDMCVPVCRSRVRPENKSNHTPKAPIVASFLTVIKKLPDFESSRTSVDKRFITKCPHPPLTPYRDSAGDMHREYRE